MTWVRAATNAARTSLIRKKSSAGPMLCWQHWIVPLSDTAERDDPVRAWLSLPRRIYLDTSTLQNLYDFGGEIFEGEPFEPVGRAARVQGQAAEIGACE
jgi:hypothetical protein